MGPFLWSLGSSSLKGNPGRLKLRATKLNSVYIGQSYLAVALHQYKQQCASDLGVSAVKVNALQGSGERDTHEQQATALELFLNEDTFTAILVPSFFTVGSYSIEAKILSNRNKKCR